MFFLGGCFLIVSGGFRWGGLFAFNRKKPVFPLERAFCCLFLNLPLCFSLAFFCLPLFQLLFLCLCFFSLFFPFLFLLLLSFCFYSFSLLFAFVSWKNNIKKFNWRIFSSILCFLGVSCLVFSLFFSLLFPDCKLCFLFNSNVFRFKKPKLKNTNFWSKRGFQFFFFLSLCFAKCQKLSFFWGGPFFLANFGWGSKSTINRYFSRFLI